MNYPRTFWPPHVVELDGGYVPAPIPPGYQPQPHGPSQVQIFEGPSVLARDPSFGRRYQGPPPLFESQLLDVFSNDQFPGAPKTVGVHLFRSDVGPDGEAHIGALGIRAVITYGAGGIQNTFECDWLQGGQFNLVCSSLRISARAYQLSGAAYNPNPDDVFILGALCGLGTAEPAGTPLTYTTAKGNLNLSGSDFTIEVPDFARKVVLNIIPFGNRPLLPADYGKLAIFFVSDDFVTILKVVGPDEIFQSEGYVLPGGTSHVQIVVVDPAPFAAEVSFTFLLGL